MSDKNACIIFIILWIGTTIIAWNYQYKYYVIKEQLRISKSIITCYEYAELPKHKTIKKHLHKNGSTY